MSAIGALQIAIDTIISGDAQLGAILKGNKVYSLVAPLGSERPFVTLGGSRESALPLFRRSAPAKNGEEDIHIFSGRNDKLEIIKIYQHLDRLLNYAELPLEGHRMVRGRLTLVDIIGDDGGGSHGILRYEVLTQRNA